MRIFLIVILAVLAGVLLGSASVVSEFSYASIDPWQKANRSLIGPLFSDGHEPVAVTKADLTPPPESEGQPKARAASLTNDFGVVEEGDSGKLTYVIHNDGTAPLVLEKGKSSCKCTVSNIAKSTVPPGESTDIVVKWRTSSANDKFHKRFVIKTNDRDNAKLKFSVTGKVLPVIKFLPRSISANSMVVGEPHELEARIYYYRDQPLQIHSWRFNNRKTAKFFELTYEPLSEEEVSAQGAKSGFLCHIKIKPGLPLGDSNQELSITTNAHDKRPPRINLFVQVNDAVSVFGTRVRSGWNWSKQSLTLSPSSDSSEVSEELVVQAMGQKRAETEFKVKQVVPAELKVELSDEAKEFRGKALRRSMKLSLPSDVDAKALFDSLPEKHGYVVLETTNPDYPEVRFDVRYQADKRRTLTFGKPRPADPPSTEKASTEKTPTKKAEADDSTKAESGTAAKTKGDAPEPATPKVDTSVEVTKE